MHLPVCRENCRDVIFFFRVPVPEAYYTASLPARDKRPLARYGYAGKDEHEPGARPEIEHYAEGITDNEAR